MPPSDEFEQGQWRTHPSVVRVKLIDALGDPAREDDTCERFSLDLRMRDATRIKSNFAASTPGATTAPCRETLTSVRRILAFRSGPALLLVSE
jgi:hypothetical protein